MIPIITDRKTATGKGMLTDGRYFTVASTGQDMFLPIWYGHRLDLDRMLVTESREEIASRTDLPDLNELVRKGTVINKTIYRSHDIDLGWLRGMSEVRLDNICREFREHEFDVTPEAVMHNWKAWQLDLKSGYRDEANGYHLFTPCRHNPFSLRATSLEPELDWQKTYVF